MNDIICGRNGNDDIVNYGDRYEVRPRRARQIDATGAGDVFRAGFIYALLRQWPTEELLRFANAAAAVSCTRLGALGGIPALNEVEAGG